ncbi:penicillin-binding protein 2 [Sphaerimonospora thailandensis]|uniref:Penicillin-binding protein 2 n=1 Tax=Sphaerimonospora thailandensis TaxID=795644 RepID=A0A8J3R8W4_9ACTN|nr:penicillin-binding protein 2 [Sphaerimonospora thailandensis]GIH70214.1 penicillin-binding protein 2 [Sphaerimonospora thailandensis]
MTRLRGRLLVLQVLVIAMIVVLVVRLWQVQVMQGERFGTVATETRTREVRVPALRGSILDSSGHPLVRNRTSLVVSVDRGRLERMHDGGAAVLRRLSTVLGVPYDELKQQIRACGPGISRPCWPGSPYTPIPVAEHVKTRQALQILERQEDFPGVTAEIQSRRDYPHGKEAAALLGYLQPVTEQELERREGLKASFSGVDLVGQGGLEAIYDAAMRGKPGLRRVQVDRMGKVIKIDQQANPVPGDILVTSIDQRVQSIVEKSLDQAMKETPKSNGAAAVVLDVKTGRVVAMASRPTYDPSIWVGGIKEKDYRWLLSDKSGKPLVSRAINGTYAPGSTFKISSVSAMIANGSPLNGSYECPSSFTAAGQTYANAGGMSLGSISLHTALEKSCDTVFYKAGFEQWKADGGLKPKGTPKEPMTHMAKAYGFGRRTGIDLPGESPGLVPGRQWKKDLWASMKDTMCRRAKTGYPEMKDQAKAAYAKRLAHENCVEGNIWHAYEAINFSIGQGALLVTPLQLARAYAALVGDGNVRSPRIGWALVRPDGTLVKEIPVPVEGHLPISDHARDYIRKALAQVPVTGTAAAVFRGFDFNVVKVGGKTGTAEVYGKDDTSWFASFAPADNPRFVAVVMVAQGGWGASTAAPAVRRIWEGIYGVGKGDDGKPIKPALPGGNPPARLPVIRDGVAVQ